MRKKDARPPKEGPVWRRSTEQATLDAMPKYNGHAVGAGSHGDRKYNRAKSKRDFERWLGR